MTDVEYEYESEETRRDARSGGQWEALVERGLTKEEAPPFVAPGKRIVKITDKKEMKQD